MDLPIIIYLIGVLLSVYPAYKAAHTQDVDKPNMSETIIFTALFSLLSWAFIFICAWAYLEQR